MSSDSGGETFGGGETQLTASFEGKTAPYAGGDFCRGVDEGLDSSERPA